jgi:transcriptional regulator with XRE-family HTH domain
MEPEPESPSNAERLGNNLRRLRSTRGLTQVEVARRAGMARAHYAALEAGSSSSGGVANPRLNTILNLASALSASTADLLDGLQSEESSQP